VFDGEPQRFKSTRGLIIIKFIKDENKEELKKVKNQVSLVAEAKDVLDWIESKVGSHNEIYSKQKMVVTTLDGIDSQIHGVNENGKSY